MQSERERERQRDREGSQRTAEVEVLFWQDEGLGDDVEVPHALLSW